MSDKIARLVLNDDNVDLTVYSPTLGRDVVDVAEVGRHGVFTFDPGFMSTASCESKITFINGIDGVLLYRGYPIEQLAEKSDFMEVCYLLLNGELPNKNHKQEFVKLIQEHSNIPKIVHNVLLGFEKDAHPMAMMLSIFGALSAHYNDETFINRQEDRMLSAIRIIAKMPAIAAMCYRHSIGKVFLEPRKDLSYTENFLYMMFADGEASDYQPNSILTDAMERIFILHADHEQNASTSTVRLAGSTGTNPYAAIASGIAALWGPAHGGANEACLKMLQEIGDIKNIPTYIDKAKDKEDPFRLMGFGHRVYKNFDPRATIMHQTCHEVLAETGANKDNPLFDIAVELEKIALQDDYFISRKLYPNVDFYSGITQSAIGIPTNMFTSIFALARSAGWISQWNEMLSDPAHKISRPRQLYTGAAKRDFVPLDKR